MTATITSLPGVSAPDQPMERQPRAEVIERLKELLVRAKRGELQAIAYTYTDELGQPRDSWVVPDAVAMPMLFAIGFGISTLNQRFFAEQVDLAREVDPPEPDTAA